VGVFFEHCVQYIERSLLLLVTSASDLQMHAVKFSSVVFGVTSRLSVVNKIHWWVARRRLLIAGDGRHISAITYTLPWKCWRHATVQQWSMPMPDINRTSQFLPEFGVLSSEYWHKFFCGKTRMVVWLPDKNLRICLLVSTDYTNATDRQTDTAWRHRPRLCIALRGKNSSEQHQVTWLITTR